MKSNLVLVFCTIVFLSVTVKLSESVQQNGTRYRGTMISTHLQADAFQVLASWKANHVRWQLHWESGGESTANVSQYIAWLESALSEFDAMVPVLRDLGLHILLDLHSPPGGQDEQRRYRIFTEQQFQDCFLTVWRMMANRYKNETLIMGYDILNEPDDRILAPGLLNWRNLSILAIQNIRAIDSLHPIIFEASPGALPNTLPIFEPLPFENIIYSIHMYEPYEFTFQNLNNNVTPIYYPGKIGDKMFNKDQLRAILQPNVDWQKAHNVSIHVGEFSAVRWAPGNSTAQYLSDLIDLYEEFGWTWNYHAFREFQGWDVEMIGDKDHPQRSPVPTDRQLALMNGLKKNEQ